MAQQQFIKVNLEHNLSSLKIPELKIKPEITILALKENIERRYGSEPNYIKLALKSKNGEFITNMEEEMRSLDFYGVESGMIISIMDLNPNSIHKQIENIGQIEKYMMSEEDYDQLPQNFRKWKKNFLQENPQVSYTGQVQICDPEYLKNLALTMEVGMRCQLENGSRGEIKFVGKCLLGYGYFIGIELDQKIQEGGNGEIEGVHYFFSTQGKAIFLRPNKIQVGQYPKIEQSDQI